MDWDTGWILQYSKPQSPESIYHWNAPRNFANHGVSAHLSLAQRIQEVLSTTEDQTSRNSSPKCSGHRLWRSPLPCQGPSWWCGHTGSSRFVTSYSWQSPPPSAEGRVAMWRGPWYECCGDLEMSLWSPNTPKGAFSFPQFTPFQGMWTHHMSQPAPQKENDLPPAPSYWAHSHGHLVQRLGGHPIPFESGISQVAFCWSYHTILLQFILVLIIHHSSIAYWNKHWNICQIFSQILFCTFLMQEAFVSLNSPVSSCFSYWLICDLTILGPPDLCFLYVTAPVFLPG